MLAFRVSESKKNFSRRLTSFSIEKHAPAPLVRIDRCGKKVYPRRVSLTRSLPGCIRDALRLCARRRRVAHPFLSAPSHGNATEAFARTVPLGVLDPHTLFLPPSLPPSFFFASLRVCALSSLSCDFTLLEELDSSDN